MADGVRLLVVDSALESDPDFNVPLIDAVNNLGPHDRLSPEDVLTKATVRNYGAVILSGVPDDLDRYPYDMVSDDISIFIESGIPILGICLGHQQLGIHFGASLVEGSQAEVGQVTVEKVKDVEDELFVGLDDRFTVEAMHLGAVTVPAGFAASLTSDVCDNQAMTDETGLVHGVQFHPERSTEVGHQIFENFIKLSN